MGRPGRWVYGKPVLVRLNKENDLQITRTHLDVFWPPDERAAPERKLGVIWREKKDVVLPAVLVYLTPTHTIAVW